MKHLLALIALAGASRCGAQTITNFPYSTGFEGVEGTLNENFPPGWTAVDLNTPGFGNQGWQIIKNSQAAQNARTDSTAVHMFANFNEDNNDFLFTPPVLMDQAVLYTFSFWYKVSEVFPSIEALDVQLYTAADPDSAVGLLFIGANITNTGYAEGSIEFSPNASGEYYFGFHSFSDMDNGFILLVDDVSIENGTSAVPTNALDRLAVWPNPASTFVRMTGMAGTTVANVQVLALDGREVISVPFTSWLDVSSLPQGDYILRIHDPARGPSRQSHLVIAR